MADYVMDVKPKFDEKQVFEPQAESLGSKVLSFFFGKEPTVFGPEGKVEYPTPEEVEQAQANEMFYGTNVDAFTSGLSAISYKGPPLVLMRGENINKISDTLTDPKNRELLVKGDSWAPTVIKKGHKPRVIKPNELDALTAHRFKQIYATAALAANKSAIASLGFDPRTMAIDPVDHGLNLGGLYMGDIDAIYANLNLDDTKMGQALVHEATHRSFKLLRDDPATKDIVKKLMPYKSLEEWVTRFINDHYVGGLPQEEDPYTKEITSTERFEKLKKETTLEKLGIEFKDGKWDTEKSLEWMDDDRRAVALEKLAEQVLAKKKPGGPR